jgi:hypothetical protein
MAARLTQNSLIPPEVDNVGFDMGFSFHFAADFENID